ncbi:hypothetical protein BCS62_22180 [Vibrio cyclitrophicus]
MCAINTKKLQTANFVKVCLLLPMLSGSFEQIAHWFMLPRRSFPLIILLVAMGVSSPSTSGKLTRAEWNDYVEVNTVPANSLFSWKAAFFRAMFVPFVEQLLQPIPKEHTLKTHRLDARDKMPGNSFEKFRHKNRP